MDYSKWFEDLTLLLPRLILFLALAASALLLIQLARLLFRFIHLLRQKAVYLEITPPAFTDRLPPATNQLFSALHGLGSSKSLLDRLLNRQSIYSLEIVSTKNEGIRYLVRVSQTKIEALKQAITAYLPEVRVQTVSDYLTDKPAKIVEFRQKTHFAYPLQAHNDLKSHDPMAYLTNAMTRLRTGGLMAYQLVLVPVRIPQAELLNRKILNNEDIVTNLGGNRSFMSSLMSAINGLMFGLLDAVGSLFYHSTKTGYYASSRELEYKKQVAKRIRPPGYFQHELAESIHHKLSQPLFRASIRLLIQTEGKDEVKSRRKSFISALSLFSVPNQDLRAKRQTGLLRSWQAYRFRVRLPGLIKRSSNLLSVSEVSGLYHFPHSLSAKTENVIKSLSKTLPAPVSLKNGAKADILLGENHYHGSVTPIGLTASERERHVYIIGGTGNGKTTMLLYGIVQDIKAGKGLAVIDPHGDLAVTLLKHIPEERINDVVYLNPADIGYPIGLNVLELPAYVNDDELILEKDLAAEAVVSVFRKIFSEDDTGGHRIEYVLRNAVHTAFTVKDASLFTVLQLLRDPAFRSSITSKLEDKDLKDFWNNEFGKAGAMQRVKMSLGVTSKLDRFNRSAPARRMLEQPRSTIDFDDILNSGKILICNFSKGLLGEDVSTLFGTTLLARLQIAALRRARLSQEQRQPVYLYVDEFQNFATMAFVQMLSEARKYKLFLTMAEQSTSQQEYQRLVDIILANVGTVICFRSGSPIDEDYVLPLFRPYIDQGEIASLPAYNFYAKIAALQTQEPMSGQTVLLSNRGSEAMAKRVVEASRKHNAIRYIPKIQSHNSKELEQIKKPVSKQVARKTRSLDTE